MGCDFTAADQAFLLIDIVATLAALFVWVFWHLEKAWRTSKAALLGKLVSCVPGSEKIF
jgi:hypothetical protein